MKKRDDEAMRFSVRLRQPAIGWLYALRLRMGQDGQLAETATVVRAALERLNASQDAIGSRQEPTE